MTDRARHRTAVVAGTLSSIPNYPKKLKIYLNNASPYWQATMWDKGRTYRRSSKTTNKLEAIKFAKEFYEQILISKYQSSGHLKQYPLIDPKKYRNKKPGLLFKEIAEQWIETMRSKWSDNYRIELRRQLIKNICPFVADKPIKAIRKSDLLAAVKKMEQRDAHVHSRRVLSVCGQIWRYAIVIDECSSDLTKHLGLPAYAHKTKHQNAVAVEDFRVLMRDISGYCGSGDEISKLALQLIALTFVRKNELVGSRWSEFDLDKAVWRIPAERMKMRLEHIVPLSKQTLSILQIVKERYPGDGYVLHQAMPDKKLGENALLDVLYRLGYKYKMSVHGFRAIASTILNEHGFRPDVIERQLAHVELNASRRAYNRAQYMDERVAMMNWWGDYIESLSPF